MKQFFSRLFNRFFNRFKKKKVNPFAGEKSYQEIFAFAMEKKNKSDDKSGRRIYSIKKLK
jgi:hypothetical protein